jgi:molybdate transport system substrate-binding protein
MKKLAAILLVLAALVGGLAYYQHQSTPRPGQPALLVYCAAGLKTPVEAVAEQYRYETGVDVRLQFGGSGTLLSTLRAARQGDLYIAADEGSVSDARKADVVQEVFPVAVQHPVVAVRKGNPKHIRSLDDLLRADVKLALANPDAASISRVSRSALGEKWKPLAAHATVMKPTVTEVAGDVNLGTVDAGIVWDAVVAQFKQTETVEIPEIGNHQENASACVLAFSAQPTAALRFAHYLTAPDKGGAIFKESGFTPAGGEKWVGRSGRNTQTVIPGLSRELPSVPFLTSVRFGLLAPFVGVIPKGQKDR